MPTLWDVAAIYLVPALLSVAACGAGHALRETERSQRAAAITLVALTLITGASLATGRDPDVSTDDFVTGVIGGALLLCALPLAAYYFLGRRLRNPLVLAVLWLASQPPFYFYVFFSLIWSADHISCPPDAYECPL